MTGVVAAFIASVVIVAGLAASVFLVAGGSVFRAAVAAGMTSLFAVAIWLLTPLTSVDLHHGSLAILRIRQASLFPAAAYVVTDAEEKELALLRKPLRARVARELWLVEIGGRTVAEAVEPSWRRVLLRKAFGMFSRRWDANLRVASGGIDCGRIRRRGPNGREVTISGNLLDPRVTLALAIVIFGGER